MSILDCERPRIGLTTADRMRCHSVRGEVDASESAMMRAAIDTQASQM